MSLTIPMLLVAAATYLSPVGAFGAILCNSSFTLDMLPELENRSPCHDLSEVSWPPRPSPASQRSLAVSAPSMWTIFRLCHC